MADDAQALEGRPVARLPILEKIGEDGIELFFRRVPGLVEVVVNARGIDGANGGLGVGVSGEEHAACVRIDVARPLQQFHAGHAGHALVADDQRHGFVARFQLGQRIQRGLPAGGAHHPVGFAILPAQVLDHGLKDAYVVVNCQEDWPRHRKSLEPHVQFVPIGRPRPPIK